jgi:hypothetical protein
VTDLKTRLEVWTTEVVELRFQEGDNPDPTDSPQETLLKLQRVRQRVDRVEEILLSVTRVKGAAHRQAAISKALYDDRWDQAANEAARSPVRQEYQGPRERYAQFNLTALVEKHKSRQDENTCMTVDTAYDVVKLASSGLNGLRQDLLTVLRALQFQSTLES